MWDLKTVQYAMLAYTEQRNSSHATKIPCKSTYALSKMNPGVQILSTGNTIAAALDVVVFHSSPGSFHIYGGK